MWMCMSKYCFLMFPRSSKKVMNIAGSTQSDYRWYGNNIKKTIITLMYRLENNQWAWVLFKWSK